MTGHPRYVGVHAMSKSFSARGVSMAAAFSLFSSTLRRHLTCRHRLVTMAALISTFLLGVGGTRAHAQEIIEYYGTDALGSVRVVFAPDGTVKARSDYLPFGEELPTTPVGQLPSQRFTGQQRDAEEGHDNFNARSYQARTGRFMTVDPIFEGVFQPQSWNRYAYVQNSPAGFTDPTGMVRNIGPGRYGTENEPMASENSGPGWCVGSACFSPPTGGSYPSQGGGRGRTQQRPTPEAEKAIDFGFTEQVTVTAQGDEGTALDGSEIPACPNCLPYKGDPDRFLVTDDFVSGFLNGGGLSIGGLFRGGSSVVAKGAFSRILSISPRLAEKGWAKHGSALGLGGKWYPAMAGEFRAAVNQHINNPAVTTIQGTYRGMDVIHYLHPRTHVNVMSDTAGNYISVWQLSPAQLESVLKSGRLF